MSEPTGEDAFDAPDATEASEAASSGTAPPATGHPAVDEVLRSLEDLDSRPVDEHVGAFEQAHDRLRRALSDAGDDGGGPAGDGETQRED